MCVCVFSHVRLFVTHRLNPPGSSVHDICQAGILERVDISCSRGSSRPRDGTCMSCVSCIGSRILYLCATWEIIVLLKFLKYAAAAKSLQSCLTLCDPIDGSPPGSPIPGFSRQEHWSGLPFPSPMHESEKWKWSCSVMSDSLWPHGLPAHQAPLSMEFSRQEHWNGLPLPSPL